MIPVISHCEVVSGRNYNFPAVNVRAKLRLPFRSESIGFAWERSRKTVAIRNIGAISNDVRLLNSLPIADQHTIFKP